MSKEKAPPRGKAGADDDALMRRIDDALASWPQPEGAARKWEAPKGASEGGDARASSQDDVLRPPLPASPAEVDMARAFELAPREPASRARRGASLLEVAKLASRAAPSGDDGDRREDSGVIVLSEIMASGVSVQATQSPQTTAASIPADRPVHGRRRRVELWIALGGAIAGAAVAAGAIFALQRPRAEASLPAASPSPVVSLASPVVDRAVPALSAAALPATADDSTVDPSKLPVPMASVAREAASVTGLAPAAAGSRGATAARTVGSAARTAGGPTAPAESAVTANTPPPPSESSKADLGELMQQAAGVAASAPAGATESPPLSAAADLPRRPSLGAIQGALGMVLPAARVCLGPDDPISKATLTFRSDGSVESVTISGGALGKPAEVCVRAALMRAHVPPFAQPIFTVPATVRPN